MKIKKITSEPRKTNTSDGNWAVDYVQEIPIGTKELESVKFFWSKKEAEEWIDLVSRTGKMNNELIVKSKRFISEHKEK